MAHPLLTFGNFIRNELTDTIEQIFVLTNESQQCFCIFLDKNGILFADGNKLIDDHTLVALLNGATLKNSLLEVVIMKKIDSNRISFCLLFVIYL